MNDWWRKDDWKEVKSESERSRYLLPLKIPLTFFVPHNNLSPLILSNGCLLLENRMGKIWARGSWPFSLFHISGVKILSHVFSDSRCTITSPGWRNYVSFPHGNMVAQSGKVFLTATHLESGRGRTPTQIPLTPGWWAMSTSAFLSWTSCCLIGDWSRRSDEGKARDCSLRVGMLRVVYKTPALSNSSLIPAWKEATWGHQQHSLLTGII